MLVLLVLVGAGLSRGRREGCFCITSFVFGGGEVFVFPGLGDLVQTDAAAGSGRVGVDVGS